MIVELSREDERGESHKAQMNAFFDLLEERFMDISPYCRTKAIQVYIGKLLEYARHDFFFYFNLMLTLIASTSSFPNAVREPQTAHAEVSKIKLVTCERIQSSC